MGGSEGGRKETGGGSSFSGDSSCGGAGGGGGGERTRTKARKCRWRESRRRVGSVGRCERVWGVTCASFGGFVGGACFSDSPSWRRRRRRRRRWRRRRGKRRGRKRGRGRKRISDNSSSGTDKQ